MRTILIVTVLILTACADLTRPVAPEIGAPSFSAAAEHLAGSFFAVAACNADIGYDIQFGGPRVLVRHVAGSDTTLSFRTQDFQGWTLPETVFDQTTVDFEVLGGAEMFNIKREPGGALEIRIHEGTLVFSSIAGDHTVIARHVIRTIPGNGPTVNQWNCRLGGGG